MKDRLRNFKRQVGANPLELLTILSSFALVGYAWNVLHIHLWNTSVWWKSILVWFLGALLAHDLLLFPLYALADRSLVAGSRAVTRHNGHRVSSVSPLNYIRLPLLGSGLLLLLFFPGIIQQGKGAYLRATGLTQAPYLDRWLVLSGSMFLLSAVLYAIRVGRVARRSSSSVSGVAEVADPEKTHGPTP
ncbi:MAG: hypothetical protein WA580_04715 [Acidimicrobiales bacterium]